MKFLPPKWFVVAGYLCVLNLGIYSSVCQAQVERFYFKLPVQPADQSLTTLAKTSNQNILFRQNDIQRYQTSALVGYYSVDEALDVLFRGTPLTASYSHKGALIVKLNPGTRPKGILGFLGALFSGPPKTDLIDKPKIRFIEEIIVTAQKREESVLDVPVALSVLGAEQISHSHAKGIENLAPMIPSVTIRKGNTTRNSAVFLRGIGTFSFSVAAEPSVSTVIDGVVLSRSGQAFSDLYDIERIEVLRGPQGTLFGKNASAGVLNITTRQPTELFESDIELSLFQEGEKRLKGTVSGSLTDDFSARISGFYGSFDGHHLNQFDGNKINGYERKGLRGLFDYKITSNLRSKLSMHWYDARDNCCIELVTDRNASIANAVNSLRQVDHDLTSMTLDRSTGASLTVDWGLEDRLLTSISAYNEWDNTERNDRDYSSSVNRVFGSLPNAFQLHEVGIQSFRQFSQELRLSSNDSSPLQYTLGLFYLDVRSNRQFTRDDLLCITTTLANSECSQNDSFFLAPSATADMTSYFKNHAIFGQGSYALNDDVHLIAGFRWTRDRVGYRHNRVGNADHRTLVNVFETGAPGIRDQDFGRSDDQSALDFSGKLGIQYELASDLMAYGTVSTGFKGPAFDVSFSFVEERSAPILPENSTSYEIGVKGLLGGGKIYTALAAYYTELDQYQTNNVQLLSGNITSNLVNVGQVVSSGVELDFASNLSDRLRAFGGFSFLHKANIRDPFCSVPNNPNADDLLTFTACQARTNERLMLAPKRKLALGVEYKRPLGEALDLHIGTQYMYRSEMFSNDLEDSLELLESIHTLNANIGVSNKTDSQRLTLAIKNLSDRHYATQVICCIAGGAPASGDSLTYQIPREADRYVGLAYRASF